MKLAKIFFYSLCCFFHFHLHAFINIYFSNNSENTFHVVSESVVNSFDSDYNMNQIVEPFVSNVPLFHLPSTAHEQYDLVRNIHISIVNKQYNDSELSINLSLKRTQDGYEILYGNFLLPSKSIAFNPSVVGYIDLSDYWQNRVVRLMPSKVYKNGIMWPSLGIVVDNKNYQEEKFNNYSANAFRVMNYNVQIWPFYTDLGVPPNKKLVRARSIPKLIGDGFDAIALNEIFDADIRRKIKLDMKKNYPYLADVGGIDSLHMFSSGILVFSKWPIIKRSYHTYRSCYDIECLGAKGVTYVKIKKTVDGQDFYYNVFATHMQSKHPSTYASAATLTRTRQLKELNEFIQAQNISNLEPVIIVGDFNIDAFEINQQFYEPANLQTEYEFMLQGLNASDSKHSGLKYSFDSLLNTMLALSPSKERVKIDHILYKRDHLQPIYSNNRVSLLRETGNPVMYPHYDTSDHFPIIGEFIF